MILQLFLIPLNILLLGMMIFLILAFRKEKGDEKHIQDQFNTIKKTYEDKTAESDRIAKESQQKMDEAINTAKAAEDESKRVNAECEEKITKMTADVQKKMDELNNLENTLRTEAEAKVKQFENEQREEIEKNMVSIVMNVTKKVLEKTLTYEEHKEIIKKSIDEIKTEE